MKTKNTQVCYVKNEVTYTHTFNGYRTRSQVEQYVIMEQRVGRSAIVWIQ